MVVGAEYYSKRGWAPNGDFRYKGPGLDHLIVRWNALLDRGVEQQIGSTPCRLTAARPSRPLPGPIGMNSSTRAAWMWSHWAARTSRPTPTPPASTEYLSSYVYRLVFNDNFSQAVTQRCRVTFRSRTSTTDSFLPLALGSL